MAESSSAALAVASIPSSAEISRAEKLVRERFLQEGEDPAVALAPGSPRRLALDTALAELQADPKAKNPSTAWRREFSLLLGLERVLSEDEPHLADGTVLSAHQVDALSGTLAALLASAQAAALNGNGKSAASASPELLASAEIFGLDEAPQQDDVARPSADEDADDDASDEDDEEPDEDDLDDDDDEDDDDLGPVQRAAPDEDEDDDDELDDEVLDAEEDDEEEPEEEPEAEAEEEPRDWADEDDAEESLADQPEDPNAAKRFWFEHATGAGKTVAALGFVEASQTGGVLILTHRRNLVDQFNGELRERGYAKRISNRCSRARTPPRAR